LLQNLGVANGASAARILPYVERLGTIALGTGSADGAQQLRIVISGS
jgi:di/tricarboxylate transporter